MFSGWVIWSCLAGVHATWWLPSLLRIAAHQAARAFISVGAGVGVPIFASFAWHSDHSVNWAPRFTASMLYCVAAYIASFLLMRWAKSILSSRRSEKSVRRVQII